MSKILTIPSTLDEIKKTKDIVDGFIIGIKDMSVNMNLEIDDLSILNEIKDKDIFISINKNIHNTELDKLKQILKDLNNYKIKGVLYSDVALVNLSKKFKLNYDLVWSSEHSVTNYNTINYYNSLGVKYAYLSSDITIEEVKEIKKNTKSKLLFNIFGYLPMFVSRRHIVKNYLNYFNLNDNSTINYIEKEDKVYPIIDNKTHTSVYSNNILNGIKAYLDLDLDYAVINSFDIDEKKLIEIINIFKTVNKNNVDEFESKINSMFKNIDTGFLYKKTIYKVK